MRHPRLHPSSPFIQVVKVKGSNSSESANLKGVSFRQQLYKGFVVTCHVWKRINGERGLREVDGLHWETTPT